MGVDRNEEYTVRGGEGLFEIRGGSSDFGLAVLFQGSPIAFLWPDCAARSDKSKSDENGNAHVFHFRESL